MNVNKTNVLVFPKNKANDISVKLSEITITKVEHCPFLGEPISKYICYLAILFVMFRAFLCYF